MIYGQLLSLKCKIYSICSYYIFQKDTTTIKSKMKELKPVSHAISAAITAVKISIRLVPIGYCFCKKAPKISCIHFTRPHDIPNKIREED